jgi:hypothetical protein
MGKAAKTMVDNVKTASASRNTLKRADDAAKTRRNDPDPPSRRDFWPPMWRALIAAAKKAR